MNDPLKIDIPLDRDRFFRALIRELSGTLQDVVGLDEASGYISVVGAAVGEQINGQYRKALCVQKLDRAQVRDALLGLKRRIDGDFFVMEESENRLVLGNRRCPFGDYVADRPALCMMTSNVFGHVAAQNLGYAGVELKQTIAEGSSGCIVIVYFSPPENSPEQFREYFERDDSQ